MNKWIAEFELEDGDTMPEHMDLEYKGTRIDFHCKPLEQESTTKNNLAVETTQMIDKSNFSQEQYKSDLQSAYDCGYAQAKNDLGVDTISRADAIKAVRNKAKKLKNEDTINGLCGAVAILYNLPSVTPQNQVYPLCEDCRTKMDEVRRAYDNAMKQEPILDKLEAEIDKIYEREGNSVDCLNALDELKWFIDKYKAESEK